MLSYSTKRIILFDYARFNCSREMICSFPTLLMLLHFYVSFLHGIVKVVLKEEDIR